MVLGVMYAWSIFILPLETHFGWKRAETSLTFSLIIMFFSLGTILSGLLLPRLNPTRTAILGGLVAGSGFFLSSFTSSLTMFYICYGVMGGLGIGLAYIVPVSVVVRWFPDKKGLISGLLTMGMALGTFVLGSLGANHLLQIMDWQTTFRIMGAVVAGVSIIVALLLKMPPADFKPHGYTPPPQQEGVWGFSFAQAIRLKPYWMVFAWIFLLQTGGLMVMSHIVPFIKELDLSQSQAAFGLGAVTLANAGGRFFFGFLFDKAGRKKTMTITGLVLVAGLVTLPNLPAGFVYPALLLAVILVGMSYGGSIAQLVVLCISFFGPKNFSIIFAFSTMASMVASFTGPYLAGHIKDTLTTYDMAMYLAALLATLAIILALTLKPPQKELP